VSALEREIDQLVYALYGLTLEEIQIVAQRNEHPELMFIMRICDTKKILMECENENCNVV